MKTHTAGSLLTESALVGQPAQHSASSATLWLLSVAQSALLAPVRWLQERRDIGELKRLDDRLLADIGISRGEIEAGVRLGRWSKRNADLDREAIVIE